MKKTFILACAFVCFYVINGQADNVEVSKTFTVENTRKKNNSSVTSVTKWEFMSTHKEPTAEELASFSDSEKFGKKAAYFYDIFKETYVTKEEVVPGDPTKRTIIRKPEIYNAVRSIEKALGKAIKKKEISREESCKQFCHVLEVSLAAIDSDTQSLEDTLNSHRKDPKSLLAIFQNVSLQSIY